MDQKTPDVREAVAVFDTEEAPQGAIDELLISGFSRTDLSARERSGCRR